MIEQAPFPRAGERAGDRGSTVGEGDMGGNVCASDRGSKKKRFEMEPLFYIWLV
jgi:hypothetical protein